MDMSNDAMTFIKINGGTALLHEKYKYHILKKYKSGAAIWRCSNYRNLRCLGTITIKDEYILSKKPHACNPDVQKNMKLIEISNLKKIVQESDKPIPKLYEKKVLDIKNKGFDILMEIPKFESVKHQLYDARNKFEGVPKTVFRNIEEVVIPKTYNDFVLADYYCNGRRIIVFCTPESREKIKGISEIFIDGTFKSCPSPFDQLFTVHAEMNSTIETNNVIPLLFALMSDRKTDSYIILFNLIKSQLPQFQVTKIHCDFEIAIINAMINIFPEAKIIGCYYHWCRAVWRKAKSLGHTKSKAERRIVSLTAALPLIPADITDGWLYIKAECGDEIEMPKFINYMERHWFNKSHLKNIISVFGERHRTNNILEGWHSKLNRSINKNTVTVLRLLKVLFQFETLSNITEKRKGNKTKRRSLSIINDDVITRVQMQLINGEISLGHALDKLR